MNDYKELVFNLMFLAKYCHSEFNDLRVDDELKNAADAIEQLVKERDAAIADLKMLSDCRTCKNNTKPFDCMGYEWHGMEDRK